MDLNKTIRILEPHGGWGNHDMGYYLSGNLENYTKYDTGLCNRIFHWEVLADILIKSNDSDLKLLVQNKIWPELEILEIPHTSGIEYQKTGGTWRSKYEYDELHMKSIYDLDTKTIKMATPLTKKKLYSMYRNKKFNFNKQNHLYTDFGYETLSSIHNYISKSSTDTKSAFNKNNRPLQKIKLKHTMLKEHVDGKYRNFVGIHIRRGNGVTITEDDILSYPENIRDEYRNFVKNNVVVQDVNYKFYSDKIYFEIIDKILEINPTQEIYISHDLPDELIQQYYTRYGNSIRTKYDDREFYQNYYMSNKIDVLHMVKYGNVIDNVMDLMTLSHCPFIITSPHSSWSGFAYSYKNATHIDVDKGIDKIIYEYKNFLNLITLI